MRTAEIAKAIVIQSEQSRDGITVLTTACADYQAFSKLPSVVRLDGRLFGKTAWNSDSNVAYFRSDARVAEIVQ